ncbi:hypothetical protein LOD99_3468 [Oopsacas minuta]|uniref:Metallo-beta-lactamase domain-containing protein n=1 Tax=Oopsacas minuta TaxID=111878 RepID=A0AAV7JXY7_9METZ|nr:hypothetical protein LOD99_3468 [Oopsacas minuta]
MHTLRFGILLLTVFRLTYGIERTVEVRQTSYDLSKTLDNHEKDLQIEMIPLGDGDSTIINCPNGDVIVVDMGKPGKLGWSESMVASYLRKKFNNVTTIVISHPTPEHFNFLPKVFHLNNTKSLTRIVLAGKTDDYTDSDIKRWITAHSNIVEFVNEQKPCISECRATPPICNGSKNVTFRYIGANLGMTKAGRSIMMQITAPNFQLLLPGDFQGEDIEELIAAEWDRLGQPIKSSHMKLSRHGSNKDCNSKYLIKGASPEFAYTSNSYPGENLQYPSCATIDRLLQIRTIRKRSETAPFACFDSENEQVDQYRSWPYQIYSTAPAKDDYKLISIRVPVPH